jgi:hypothetical protein
VLQTANRSLEDIDRFFETSPSIIVCRNKLATQLSRPQTYIDQDERIAQETDAKEWNPDVKKNHDSVNVEQLDERKDLK